MPCILSHNDNNAWWRVVRSCIRHVVKLLFRTTSNDKATRINKCTKTSYILTGRMKKMDKYRRFVFHYKITAQCLNIFMRILAKNYIVFMH